MIDRGSVTGEKKRQTRDADRKKVERVLEKESD